MRGTSPINRDSDGNERSDLEQIELGKPPSEPGLKDSTVDWRKQGPVADLDATGDDGRMAAFVSDDRAPATGDGDAFAAEVDRLVDPADGTTEGLDEDAVVAEVDEPRRYAAADEEESEVEEDPIDELIARLEAEAEQADAADPLMEELDQPVVAVADAEPSYGEQEWEPIEAGADVGYDDTAPA